MINVVTNAKTGEIEQVEFTPAEIDAANEAQLMSAKEAAKTELLTIDAASIRAMREYIASKADAPQVLKDKEAAAVSARLKIK
jgi:mono/diheme cytochrome c family protein